MQEVKENNHYYRLRHTSHCKTKHLFPIHLNKIESWFLWREIRGAIGVGYHFLHSSAGFSIYVPVIKQWSCLVSTTPIWSIFFLSSFCCLQSAKFRQISYGNGPTYNFTCSQYIFVLATPFKKLHISRRKKRCYL